MISSTNKKYKLYKSSDGKYAFSFGKWGFYNKGWSGQTQPYINDPNEKMVIKFNSESEARQRAEELTKDYSITWDEI